MNAAPKVFAGRRGRTDEVSERKLAELYEQLGRLMVDGYQLAGTRASDLSVPFARA